MAAGVIQLSTFSWAAAPYLVKKKSGDYSYCIDYHVLNKVTKEDIYPLRLMQECINSLEGNVWFSKLDANSAYFQVPVHPLSKENTARAIRV